MAKDCWNQPLFVKYITIFIHLFSVRTSLYHNGAKFQTCLVKRECISKTKLSSAPLIENKTYYSKTTCAHIIWGKLSTPWILLVGCLPRSNSNHCVLYTELKKNAADSCSNCVTQTPTCIPRHTHPSLSTVPLVRDKIFTESLGFLIKSGFTEACCIIVSIWFLAYDYNCEFAVLSFVTF